LKICSGTILCTSGAAHGNGIYLSDTANLSFNYGRSGLTSVIGVFEVINAERYFKVPGIFVVDDDTQLLQKYLLIIPSKNQHLTEKINTAFLKTIHEEQKTTNQIYNKKCIMKIIKEYRLLKSNKNLDFRIDVNPECPYLWKIFINKFDDNAKITTDMKKLNVKEIELELKFSNDYPFSPPFIRVVKPIFVPLTGHLTLHGAICHEILSSKGWIPTCSIEMLIQLVIYEVAEDGRIDMINYNNIYDYEECKKSFNQMVVAQGWA
jgi:ubiquitin-protein ligase